jgi:hypothetical protein
VEAALERLLPRWHESERIEPEGLGRDAADDQVAMVNGVERSAEEAYHGPVDVIPTPADVIPRPADVIPRPADVIPSG